MGKGTQWWKAWVLETVGSVPTSHLPPGVGDVGQVLPSCQDFSCHFWTFVRFVLLSEFKQFSIVLSFLSIENVSHLSRSLILSSIFVPFLKIISLLRFYFYVVSSYKMDHFPKCPCLLWRHKRCSSGMKFVMFEISKLALHL